MDARKASYRSLTDTKYIAHAVCAAGRCIGMLMLIRTSPCFGDRRVLGESEGEGGAGAGGTTGEGVLV